jgi:predicted metal-dependent HD superfamily phosphohydrolase
VGPADSPRQAAIANNARVPSYDECLVDAELRARAAYAEPHRYYHDERHLNDCLRQLDDIHDLNERDRRLLHWAILWHDSIYDPHRSDNEERSADLAFRELSECGISASSAAEVAQLIRLTKDHRVEPGDTLGALLVSIDLSILGSDPGRYSSYVTGIRREYVHVPEEAWRSARAAMLKQLIESDPLYPDTRFQEALEEPARENMKAELKQLGEG